MLPWGTCYLVTTVSPLLVIFLAEGIKVGGTCYHACYHGYHALVTGDTGSDSECICTTVDDCCDGCNPIKEGGNCPNDNADCTDDLCRGGACAHELQPGFCLIDDTCHPDAADNPKNDCQYCDVLFSTSAWRNKISGMDCDDGDDCTQDDRCNGLGGCVGDEFDCINGDGCCPSSCGFDDEVDCPCETPDDVRQPGTDLCWRRCPLGQTWSGTECQGSILETDWCDASGESYEGYCSADNPFQSLCEVMLDMGYRLPLTDEFTALLGGEPCSVTACGDMFGPDIGSYWSEERLTMTDAVVGRFETGQVGTSSIALFEEIRCLRVGP